MRLLIIRPGALGDTLLLLPSIVHLKGRAEIYAAGRYPGIDYLRPYVNSCIDYESGGWHKLFLDGPGTDFMGNSPEPDLVAAFLSDQDGIALNNLKVIFPSARVHSFTPFPQEGEDIHAALYIARSLQYAGLQIDPEKAIAESISESIINPGETAVEKDLIVLHPGSGSENKNYSPGLWLDLIKLLESYELKSVIVLGPAEEGIRPVFKNIKGLNIVFCPEREALSGLLGRASLYIGHDSGITHLAAMMGIPVIALFRNSSSIQWGPRGPFVEIFEEQKDETALIRKIMERVRYVAG